ncbi:PEP-CTERM sorting domain-containing protein [Amantichitinum ursilacus]|uniref:PEP-CTERM motif protein n=1 Tax=Amantichitinum ursilacus TaxID=857265 RepID=A0A0N0GQ42_9NEIS|nr:PEP-CTERM sorting domain-containing protein [Amantichitinum ursilacus]KPC54442.1 PEP-CTERM motif protein [Amantichitinum ursilacus]
MKKLAAVALLGMALASGMASAKVIDSGSTNIKNKTVWTTGWTGLNFGSLAAGDYSLTFSFTSKAAESFKVGYALLENWNIFKPVSYSYDKVNGTSWSETVDFDLSSATNVRLFAGLIALADRNTSWCNPADYSGKFSWELSTVDVSAPIPEPETYALMGLGLVALVAARRRKQK